MHMQSLGTYDAEAQSQLDVATSLQESCAAWANSLLQRYPSYRDILEPVQTAAGELQYGLSLMVTARQLGGTDSQGVSAQLATLMRYPKPARLHLTPRLVPQLVARGRQTHDPSQEAVGALAARLKLLLFVLEDCSRYLGAVQQSRVPLVNETEWKTVHHVYGALLQVWVDVQNEERRLEEEAALVFKTKAKAVTLSIDEQVGCSMHMPCALTTLGFWDDAWAPSDI